MVGLDQHTPRVVTTSGATRYLHEQLRHAFAGAKIDTKQTTVRVEDSNQCHVRKMVALGEHLGADEDIDPSCLHIGQHGLQLALTLRAVPVQSRNAGTGETFNYTFSYSLCTNTHDT